MINVVQRDDDNEETVKARFENYTKQTSSLIEYYDKKGILFNAVVSKEINKLGADVARDVIEHIDNMKKR